MYIIDNMFKDKYKKNSVLCLIPISAYPYGTSPKMDTIDSLNQHIPSKKPQVLFEMKICFPGLLLFLQMSPCEKAFLFCNLPFLPNPSLPSCLFYYFPHQQEQYSFHS